MFNNLDFLYILSQSICTYDIFLYILSQFICTFDTKIMNTMQLFHNDMGIILE